MIEVTEIVINRQGILIDGRSLDRLVHAIHYDARCDDHNVVHFDCYVTDDDGNVLVDGDDARTERLTYNWLHI